MIARGGATGRRQPGWWIPWIFVAGFGVVLLVNGIMIWVAASTWTGISTNRAYDKGLTYNRNLEAAARQALLGWQARIVARPGADGRPELVVTLADAGGQPLAAAQVEATFERPTHQGHDFTLDLAPDGIGSYRAAFTAPLAGVWDVRVVATRGADRLVATHRLMVD